MKNRFLKLSAFAASLFIGVVANAQKTNETSAAVEFKNKFAPALAKKDYENAKKSLLKAKEYIDLAAANPETENSPKTLMLKGDIYTSFLGYMGMSQDTSLLSEIGNDFYEQGIEAYKKGYPGKNKFSSDIKNSVTTQKFQLSMATQALFKNNNYAEALEILAYQEKLSDAIQNIDTSAIYFAGVAAEKLEKHDVAATKFEKCASLGYEVPNTYTLAAYHYDKSGNKTKAKEIIEAGRKKYPTNKDILLQMVQFRIDEGDSEGAKNILNQAIQLDSNNKQLYYIIGTIYHELNNPEEAEKAFIKSLEIDPKYSDALYQLGALYNSQAADLRSKADALPIDQKRRYAAMNAKADEYYRMSLSPLEKYIELNPNDAVVLDVLSQIFRNLEDMEKSKEYKTKAEKARASKK